MSDDVTRPSILTQATEIVSEQPDGVVAGVVVKDGSVGAEASANVDIGKPGGWSIGAWGQWLKGKGKSAAAAVRWTPKA